jgi:hypothetical protein
MLNALMTILKCINKERVLEFAGSGSEYLNLSTIAQLVNFPSSTSDQPLATTSSIMVRICLQYWMILELQRRFFFVWRQLPLSAEKRTESRAAFEASWVFPGCSAAHVFSATHRGLVRSGRVGTDGYVSRLMYPQSNARSSSSPVGTYIWVFSDLGLVKDVSINNLDWWLGRAAWAFQPMMLRHVTKVHFAQYRQ